MEQAKDCAICLADLKQPVKLNCGHIFCQLCIETCLKLKAKCPICRRLSALPLFDTLQAVDLNEQQPQKERFEGSCSDDLWTWINLHPEMELPNLRIWNRTTNILVNTEETIRAINLSLNQDNLFCLQTNYQHTVGGMDIAQIIDLVRIEPSNEFTYGGYFFTFKILSKCSVRQERQLQVKNVNIRMITPQRFCFLTLPDSVLIGNIRTLINNALQVNPIFDNLPEDLNLIEKWSSELINNIPMPEHLQVFYNYSAPLEMRLELIYMLIPKYAPV